MEKRIHFIGIGGIGMSSLAQILKAKGHKISGSDMQSSDITDQFSDREFLGEHKEENITPDIELAIYSHAIPENNPELEAVRQRGIRTISYPQALGEISQKYTSIAIAGTHGKSTTTAMLALILEKAGLDPTVVIGTKIREFGNKNYRVGDSNYLVMEACEHKESFSNISPNILGITNIEPEHLDYYKTAENYYAAFEKLKNKTQEARGEVIQNPEKIQYEPGVPGEFNIENASLASAIAEKLGVHPEIIKRTLQSYRGSWRRMEEKETSLSPRFIDDYAHHPTEVHVTLGAIREQNPQAKIMCVFQPHQYSRTFQFIEEFGESFGDADKVLIPNIYKVRDTEEDIKRISPESLVLQINENSNNAEKVDGLDGAANYIKQHHKEYDIVVTMGAGDITSIYSKLSSK